MGVMLHARRTPILDTRSSGVNRASPGVSQATEDRATDADSRTHAAGRRRDRGHGGSRAETQNVAIAAQTRRSRSIRERILPHTPTRVAQHDVVAEMLSHSALLAAAHLG